ncbi:serine/threonine-protein kinase [Tundrisphaera lichenicola]|uniref:serine/threonine-protein kinase n=1 Tax=Tundrisphaera lichenicola TaxID=2029860 RepID=UPI003EB810D2
MARLDQFVANLARSGLVSPAAVERARSQLSDGPDSDAAARMARLLIQQGQLTSYQAKKILSGATRGFVLADYRILRPLGEGGMGKVYLAANQKDGLRVAIKVLPPSKASDNEQSLSRFRREMELSRRVQHPNLARTLDVGQAGDVHFMVLEYVPGETLYQLVKHPRGGPLRVPDAARFFLKVVDGLEAAHNAGLVHRDIKPSNLMVTPEGDARVLDLGLARSTDEVSPLTGHNTVLGTLDYASPEQLGNASQADRRSDLYSLGCTLYFALSGRPPFEGGDVVNKIFKQRMDDPEPLERVARGVPSAFAAIVRKLMAKQPEDRYQDAGELRADLARWADPAVVHSILGSEADAARAFRPPPPVLDDDDLRLLGDDEGTSLRDLGSAEAEAAPMHRPPPPPRPAVVVPRYPSRAASQPLDETAWLIRFVAGALVLGALVIVLIAILMWRS